MVQLNPVLTPEKIRSHLPHDISYYVVEPQPSGSQDAIRTVLVVVDEASLPLFLQHLETPQSVSQQILRRETILPAKTFSHGGSEYHLILLTHEHLVEDLSTWKTYFTPPLFLRPFEISVLDENLLKGGPCSPLAELSRALDQSFMGLTAALLLMLPETFTLDQFLEKLRLFDTNETSSERPVLWLSPELIRAVHEHFKLWSNGIFLPDDPNKTITTVHPLLRYDQAAVAQAMNALADASKTGTDLQTLLSKQTIQKAHFTKNISQYVFSFLPLYLQHMSASTPSQTKLSVPKTLTHLVVAVQTSSLRLRNMFNPKNIFKYRSFIHELGKPYAWDHHVLQHQLKVLKSQAGNSAAAPSLARIVVSRLMRPKI